jgi:hypothetical protein
MRWFGRIRSKVSLTAEPRPTEATPDFTAESVGELLSILARLPTAPPASNPRSHHQVQLTFHHAPSEPATWLEFSGELKFLDDWLHSSSRVCWISGAGGAGKSSLVLTWLRAFELIGYLQPYNASVLLSSLYENPDLASARKEFESWVRKATAPDLFLVWDGLELIQPTEPLEAYLLAAARNCRVLVTSRTPPPPSLAEITRHITLGPIKRSDALVLIQKSGASPELADRIFNFLEGHPLSIRLATALLQAEGPEELLKMIETRAATCSP